jgi:SAM-dependent methyltransferase
MAVYARSAAYYDALYRAQGKDYRAESARVDQIIKAHKRSPGTTLLDVGCGTGSHIEYLRDDYTCEGLDVDRAMLGIASEKNPGIPMHAADMIGFNLVKKFDVIISLFSAVGYVPSVGLLNQTLATFARHLNPGGVVIVEPWIKPGDFKEGFVDAQFANEPDLKVARMSVSRRDGNISILHYHYMVAARDGIRTFSEPHRLMLFTDEEYREAFRRARLAVQYDDAGLTGRGLYIGTFGTY